MSDELDLGNLAITITDGEPAEAKFDLPNGTSVTRTFPESGTINMRLGFGLSLSHQRPPAGGGGGGEPTSFTFPSPEFGWASQVTADTTVSGHIAAGTYAYGASVVASNSFVFVDPEEDPLQRVTLVSGHSFIQLQDSEGNELAEITVFDGNQYVVIMDPEGNMSDSPPWRETILSEGVLTFTLRAEDPGALYVEQEFTITVTA